MLKINGIAVKTPSNFKVDISDIDGTTERNALGYMFRDRIAVKRKLEIEWKALKDAEIKALLQAVKDEFFTVEYPDPMEGALVTKTMYVGDRSAPMYNFKMKIWESLNMNFIER